ncbi:MAG: DNA mismatch repair endonuclease MutL, partial [Bacteroidales bacterium]
SSFSVKNLFYNVPARRKFLKSNNVEFGHICDEFIRVALVSPQIKCTLLHNNDTIYNLPKSNYGNRIVAIFGKQYEKLLIPIKAQTTQGSVSGYITRPEGAKKTSFHQFFFANGRYIRHKHLFGVVMRCYEGLIEKGTYPPFFIYFQVTPENIDVNIHPTKTEVKFSEEAEIALILQATVKEALGKHILVPQIDFFDDENYSDMFRKPLNNEPSLPSIKVNTGYNPFKNTFDVHPNKQVLGFEQMKQVFRTSIDTQNKEKNIPYQPYKDETTITTGKFLQFKLKYIVTQIKSGLLIIDQKRAHERIMYEDIMRQITNKQAVVQQLLYPFEFQIDASDVPLLEEIIEDMYYTGFDIKKVNDTTFSICGAPSDLKLSELEQIIANLLYNYKEYMQHPQNEMKESLAKSLAKSVSIPYGKVLTEIEMQDIVNRLFMCSNQNFTADGKKIIVLYNFDEIENTFA